MNSTVDVSIIVPVYNTEHYLDACLSSLVKQQFLSYEIICIDDCSIDSSPSIINRFQKEYPGLFTVLVNNHNMGQGKSRERGIRHARGRYIMFVDSDDYVSSDYISTFFRHASKCKLDIVIGGYYRDVDGKLFRAAAPDYPWSLTTYSILCTKMFRTAFLRDNQIRFSRQRRGEDIFFNLNCYCRGAICGTIEYAGYYCRFNRSSTTRSISSSTNFEENIAAMFSELLAHLSSTSLRAETREMICYSYLVNMINALLVYGHGCGIKRMKEKYDFFRDSASSIFPDYVSNSIATSLRAQQGQTIKIRCSVWLLMNMHKLRIDFIAYAIASLL